MKVIFWDSDTTKDLEIAGVITGYKVVYDNDAELPWTVVSVSGNLPIVLAQFSSQDDMEIMMKGELS